MHYLSLDYFAGGGAVDRPSTRETPGQDIVRLLCCLKNTLPRASRGGPNPISRGLVRAYTPPIGDQENFRKIYAIVIAARFFIDPVSLIGLIFAVFSPAESSWV